MERVLKRGVVFWVLPAPLPPRIIHSQAAAPRRLRCRRAGAPRPLTRPPARRIPQLSEDREPTQASPRSDNPRSTRGHRRGCPPVSILASRWCRQE